VANYSAARRAEANQNRCRRLRLLSHRSPQRRDQGQFERRAAVACIAITRPHHRVITRTAFQNDYGLLNGLVKPELLGETPHLESAITASSRLRRAHHRLERRDCLCQRRPRVETQGVVDASLVPAEDEMVAVLAAEDERRREDQGSAVPGPVSPPKEDRPLPAWAKEAVTDCGGGSMRPGEWELRCQAATGSVDNDVDVLRRAGAAETDTLARKPGRSIRGQSGRSANLEDPGLVAARISADWNTALAAIGAERDRAASGYARVPRRSTRMRISSDRHPTWACRPNQRQPTAGRERARRGWSHRDSATSNVRLMRSGRVPSATCARRNHEQQQRDQPYSLHISPTLSYRRRVREKARQVHSKQISTVKKPRSGSRDPRACAMRLAASGRNGRS
jgi:hypothetical protein